MHDQSHSNQEQVTVKPGAASLRFPRPDTAASRSRKQGRDLYYLVQSLKKRYPIVPEDKVESVVAEVREKIAPSRNRVLILRAARQMLDEFKERYAELETHREGGLGSENS